MFVTVPKKRDYRGWEFMPCNGDDWVDLIIAFQLFTGPLDVAPILVFFFLPLYAA